MGISLIFRLDAPVVRNLDDDALVLAWLEGWREHRELIKICVLHQASCFPGIVALRAAGAGTGMSAPQRTQLICG